MQTMDLEGALCDALCTAGLEYTRTISEINTLSSILNEGAEREPAVKRLQLLAQSTRETESRVSRLRDDWKASGVSPGPRLRDEMSRQQEILSQLIQRIDSVEQAARRARDRLLPRLELTVRSQEMRSAYARTVRQAAE